VTSSTQDPHHLLVLGAGPGLGAAIAQRFGREGFAVTLVARRAEPLEALADELRDAGITAGTVVGDAGDVHGFRQILTDLARQITPDVVVYNAALKISDNLLTSDTDHLVTAHAVDVLGAVTAAQVFTPAMRRAGAGTLLVTGGSLGVSPHPAYASMSLGKASLRAAVSVLHDELKADGVHVAGITIGVVVNRDGGVHPNRIAETFWALHTQPTADWTAETVIDHPDPWPAK
jgi:short-subunit dehydrogenase